MNEVGGNGWGTLLVGPRRRAGRPGSPGARSTASSIAKAKIPPLIVTLGTLGMALGAALLITGGVDERDVPIKLVDTIGTGRLFGQLPYLVLIAFAVALVFGVILLGATRFGRYTYAIGSNEEARAARRHQRRPPPDQGVRARRARWPGSPGSCSWRASRRPRSAATPPTTSGDRRRRARRHQPVRRRRHDRSARSSACSSPPSCRTAS